MPSNKKCVNENWKILLLKRPELKKKKEKNPNVNLQLKIIEEVVGKKELKEKDNIWFDDVDDISLANNVKPITTNKKIVENGTEIEVKAQNPLVNESSFNGLTQIVAIDCEMVGVGEFGEDSILARISLVNYFGQCIYDKFVKPTEPVTDYRTFVSGIRPENIENGEDFKVVQKEVYNIIKNRILVGHAVENDLRVLLLSHPFKKIRDTSRYAPFVKMTNGRTPSLKRLSQTILGVDIQSGEHSSIQDAQAAMRLYTMHRRKWERGIKSFAQFRRNGKTDKKTKTKNLKNLL